MTALDNLNYYCDERTRGPAPDVITVYDDDGNEHELPSHWVVCPVCHGEGSHVNPSIDASGLSAEDLYDDPEFVDDYFAGVYDVICNRCDGRRVVKGVDWDALSADEQRWLEEEQRAEREYRAEVEAEIRMGC